LKSVPAVEYRAPENELSFPYNQRALLGIWKALFLDQGSYVPRPEQSAEWNRGAYLIEGLAHCGACHTPRNFLGAERASMHMTGATYMDKVPGGQVRPWSSPNITPAPNGLGSWSVEDITAYLKTGQSARAVTFGPMN